MKSIDVAPRLGARHGRLALLTALAAALVLAAIPATAGAQGAGQYEPAPPPTAGGGGGAGGTGGVAGTGGTFGSAATDGSAAAGTDATGAAAVDGSGTASGSTVAGGAVTGSSGAAGELPVTGLPVLPIAAAGLLMMLLGSLGLRRLAVRPASKHSDSDDPSGTRRILGR